MSKSNTCDVNERLDQLPDKCTNKKTEISLPICNTTSDLISLIEREFENDLIDPSDLMEIVVRGINHVNIKSLYNDFLQKIMIVAGYISARAFKEKIIVAYDFSSLNTISDKFFGLTCPCINKGIHIKIIATRPVLETAIIKFKNKFADLKPNNLIIFQIV